MDIHGIVERQREFFNSGKTLSYEFRIEALEKLRNAVKSNEAEIAEALGKDLHKTPFEAYLTETGMVLDEIACHIKNLKKWVKPKRVATPMTNFAAKSYVVRDPYGVVLIMSPWNYPVQLAFEPLVGAISAGNCAIIKPASYSPNVSSLVARIVKETFEPEFVTVIEGGREEIGALLDEKFDYIFFTGSVKVGSLVMEKAAKHLCPVTLELGGKSPVIIDKSANLRLAAKRLAFGKYLNAGQTCVAPDYLLIEKSVKEQFIAEFKKAIEEFYPNGDYSPMPHVINDKHFDRIMKLLDPEKVIIGGRTDRDRKFIEPTVMDGVTEDDPIMKEEIFAPILPIIDINGVDEAISFIAKRPKPLALYLFTTDNEVKKKVVTKLSYGGGCINDTIVHLATTKMGFGGVGNSGMGSYHGFLSFDTFSHKKSILDKANWVDMNIRYLPYSEKKMKMLKMFLK